MKKYYKCHIKKIILYLLAVILNAATIAMTGFVFAALTDVALGSDFKIFLSTSIFAIVFLVIDCYLDFLPRVMRSRLIHALLHSLREDLVNHYIQEDLHSAMQENPSERTDKLVNQLEVFENSYLRPLFSIVSSIFIFLFSLAGALYLQGILTVIMLILCFLPFLAPVINQRILSDKKQEAQKARKQYLERFEAFSRHLSVIRLTRSSVVFNMLLDKESTYMEKSTVAYEKAQSKTYTVSYGLCNIVYSGIWIIGGIFVFQNWLSVPALIAMTTLTSTVAGPIQSISDYAADFASGRKIAKEFLNFLHSNIDTMHPQNVLKKDIKKLSFCDIRYSVGEHLLFDRISAEFYKGKKYVLTGDSGSGKSTLLQMLMGIIPCEDGCININDINLLTIDKDSYYRHFTYVPQKTAIFDGTIAENIVMFQKIDEVKVIEALTKAGLSDWLSKQKKGIYTLLSAENQLSGGEERKLDIARSLYQETELILMDEPTSGLDEKNEQAIASIIASMKDKIIIVVTHSTNKSFLDIFDVEIRLSNQHLTFTYFK
jgi:ABC-type multidrug transport system fused ATPase/permease subunit